VVWTTLPVDVPVIVTVTPETTGAVAAAVKVNVDVAAGEAGVTGFGVKADAVTPVGSPLMLRVTACAPEPALTSNAETVEAALVVPWTSVTLVGATLRL
jgi:intracellular sulfur oxidation DsrE/DsrF family protein